MKENLDMRGHLTLRLIDRQGQVIREQQQHNRIVRTGRLMVAQMFGGVTSGTLPTQVTHIGIGTDATASADNQTGLVAERSPRKPISTPVYSDFTETLSGGEQVVRIKVAVSAEYDFGEGNGAQPLTEAAIFTALTGGTMYNRVVFDPVTKSNAFKLSLLWEILF
jgi:hypothetical protein